MTCLRRVVRKDPGVVLLESRSVIMSIAAPILIAAFSAACSAAATQAEQHRRAITDLDRSELSAKIVRPARRQRTGCSEADEADALAQVKAASASFDHDPRRLRRQGHACAVRGGDKPEIALSYDPSQSMTLAVGARLLRST